MGLYIGITAKRILGSPGVGSQSCSNKSLNTSMLFGGSNAND